MESEQKKKGFTLIEMLIVLALIVLLASLVIGLAGRIDNQGKERLTQSTIALLTSALEQFHDYGYSYTGYSGLSFPIDCNDHLTIPPPVTDRLITRLEVEFGTGNVSIIPIVGHSPLYSGCEAMYFFLSKVPECRQTLDQISSKLITDEDENGNRMELRVAGTDYPLLRVIDPWGKTLRYDYYDEDTDPLGTTTRRSFPLISSAGPDGEFDTDDDITSID